MAPTMRKRRMDKCCLFYVTGRVQGVFFRESARQEADRLGLTGRAVNLPDGRVEVLACGEPEALDDLEAWLQKGPPASRVKSVERKETDEAAPPGFITR